MKVDHIICDCNITYANGAVVRTGFVTNLDEEHVLEADPVLGDKLNEANKARLKEQKRQVGNYEYPDNVLTAARAQWFAAHHTPFRLKRADAEPISALDEQKKQGKSIFGGGLLLSSRAAAERAAAERAAAERAAAERAAAERWHLSRREIAIVQRLDGEASE